LSLILGECGHLEDAQLLTLNTFEHLFHALKLSWKLYYLSEVSSCSSELGMGDSWISLDSGKKKTLISVGTLIFQS
jgi:hypothetical protein